MKQSASAFRKGYYYYSVQRNQASSTIGNTWQFNLFSDYDKRFIN